MEFRALLIEIFNQLSDNDRQSLYFVVGSRVPRKARDDCTPCGSLRLHDFLFDQTLITEQNYDYFIHVFERIKCYEVAKRLRRDHPERFSHVSEEEQPSTELENSILQPNNNIFSKRDIKELKYGDSSLFQNENFNDAKNLELSYEDQCIGVELKCSSNALSSILFLYNNNRSRHARTSQSEELSICQSEFSNVFLLDSNEEISKINLYQDLHEAHSSITGIQFYMANGRKTDVFGSNDGHFFDGII
ncbi:unnamed protein product [Rotaria socialis]|uniref:DED domain-containing protein n=1 Tax=Rotaria socialis TaxID=392032 RepID=A0A820SCD3_9BILA|nr:unnamed protein product [Rotaria socialis]